MNDTTPGFTRTNYRAIQITATTPAAATVDWADAVDYEDNAAPVTAIQLRYVRIEPESGNVDVSFGDAGIVMRASQGSPLELYNLDAGLPIKLLGTAVVGISAIV